MSAISTKSKAALFATITAISMTSESHSQEATSYLPDVCGKSYFLIPGTETCLRIGGFIRVDSGFGDYLGRDADGDGEVDSLNNKTVANLNIYTRQDTEFGDMNTFVQLRGTQSSSSDGEMEIRQAYIEVGGLLAGYSLSSYRTWTNVAGSVVTTGVVKFGSSQTNMVRYIFGNEDEGFAFLVSLEHGSNASGDVVAGDFPHAVLGAKFTMEGTQFSGVAAYDSTNYEWGFKGRVDHEFNDTFEGFLMAGYGDDDSRYRQWKGDWAVWTGLSAKVSKKTALNFQYSHDAEGNSGYVANVAYKPFTGLQIIPEFVYADTTSDQKWGGLVRIIRDF